MKLTEGWGEAKKYSKGEDDGFKMEEGEGKGVRFLLAFKMAA